MVRDRGQRWGELAQQVDAGGLRHYLEGEPIHCGAVLVLQSIEYRSDECGEWSVALSRGTRVRYEARISHAWIRATLHADVGGHEFVAALEPWMRFAWPGREPVGRGSDFLDQTLNEGDGVYRP